MFEIVVGLSLLATPANEISHAISHHPINVADLELLRPARTYRIQIYDSFRQNRAEDSRWRIAGDKISRTWRRAQRSEPDRRRLIRWFRDAAIADPSKSTVAGTSLRLETNPLTTATPEVGPEQGKVDCQQDPSQDPAEAVETEDRHRSCPWLFRSLGRAVVRATTHPAVPAQPPDPVGG